MDHQANAHGQQHQVHLPDPSVWPLVVAVAAAFLGAALIYWSRVEDQTIAGPLLGAAVLSALVAVFGWAYEDGRMRKKAEEGAHGAPRPTRYTQVVTFAVAEGMLDQARQSGIIHSLESRDNQLRDLDGFQDLRIIVSPATAGPSQVLVETTWADREGLATYEETRQTMLDLISAHTEEVVPGTVQVFDMEVIRDTKDVTFRFGTGAAFTVIASLMLGGFMIGAGMTLFAPAPVAPVNGVAPPAPADPFLVFGYDHYFEPNVLTAGPNAEVTFTFVNRGRALHNIHFYDRRGGTTLAPGAESEIIEGRGTQTTLTFTTPGPGEYFFVCDLHPDTMYGTFMVVEGGPTGAPAAPAEPAETPTPAPGGMAGS
jgi:plastocyanin